MYIEPESMKSALSQGTPYNPTVGIFFGMLKSILSTVSQERAKNEKSIKTKRLYMEAKQCTVVFVKPNFVDEFSVVYCVGRGNVIAKLLPIIQMTQSA